MPPPRLINIGDLSPLAAIPKFGVVGDSQAAEQSANAAAGRFTSAASMAAWSCVLLQGRIRFDPVNNYGVGGERTDQVLTHIDADILTMVADGVRFCIDCSGTNDVFQKVASATIIANKKLIASKLRTAGITPLTLSISPRTYATLATGAERTTARNQQCYVNAELRRWARQEPGVILIDAVSTLTDPANAEGDPLGGASNPEGVTRDRLHFASRGAFLIAKKHIVPALDPLLSPQPQACPSLIDVYHATENPTGNKLTNGKLSGTTGTDGTRSAGDFPTSWTGSCNGSTLTVTGSKATTTDADGAASTEWAVLTMSGSGGTGVSTGKLFQQITPAASKYAIGDVVRLRARVRVTDADGLAGASVALVQQNATINTAISTGLIFNAVSSVFYLLPDNTWEGVVETPPMTILSDIVILQAELQVVASNISTTAVVAFADAELIPA